MKALVQFMLSLDSINSLNTDALTQILLLSSDDDNEDFEFEASELEQLLKPRSYQRCQATQNFNLSAGTWTVAAEIKSEDGNFVYQLVCL